MWFDSAVTSAPSNDSKGKLHHFFSWIPIIPFICVRLFKYARRLLEYCLLLSTLHQIHNWLMSSMWSKNITQKKSTLETSKSCTWESSVSIIEALSQIHIWAKQSLNYPAMCFLLIRKDSCGKWEIEGRTDFWQIKVENYPFNRKNAYQK